MAPERALWFMRIMRHILRQTGIHPWQMEIRSERFPVWDLPTLTMLNIYISGTTPLTALMYNVRYVLSPENGTYAGYNLVAENDVYNLYEAETPEMMGFMLDDGIVDWKADRTPLENQNDFMKSGCGLSCRCIYRD